MYHQEKPMKISKQLRLRAQEYLQNTKHTENLVEMIRDFEYGADQHSYLLALELIFTSLLKDRAMFVSIEPLKPVESTPENLHKTWLKSVYEETFSKILQCFDSSSLKIRSQALSTVMNILSYEGKYPLEVKLSFESYVPLTKLKGILVKILSNSQDNTQLINKYTEYLLFDDILFFTWKLLPGLTAKSNPGEIYIMNYLHLLGKLQVCKNNETKYLCSLENCDYFVFDETITKKILNNIWQCVMHWHHSSETHRQMLIVLLENVLSYLDKPILLTDFLMDSMDIGGPISLLALQGIYILVKDYNLNYPNIYGKLYSMFEPEIFHTKYKSRLFFLADVFLTSTHLPENLVAAFAKRLARLALVAPSEDITIILAFITNLIIRHPGLKCLLNSPQRAPASSDPYIVEERDPLKSNAINSSLWELLSLQNHVLPGVATAAKFINNPLPSVEKDLSELLDKTSNDIFKREITKVTKSIVLTFERPTGIFIGKSDRVFHYWNFN